MECKICGKTHEETELSNGIFEGRIEPVCANCARLEGIPLVKKPNPDSFEEKRENLSVRERMERMNQQKKPIQKEHFIAHKNLAKLHFPTKREDHPELIENYDWILKTARRRKKLSQTQVAEELIIPLQVIMDLESGKIAKDFMNYLDKLETFLGIRIRKRAKEKFNFQRRPETSDEERMVLEAVKQNIYGKTSSSEKQDSDITNKENLKKWTLKDLISLKRKKNNENILKVEKSELVGDDLKIEE